RQTCLRGRRPAIGRWQCASCREQFREWDERDYSAIVEQLKEHERRLITIGERIDGAGFWAAAAAVMRSADKVNKLARAIDEELRGR
ncbi:MAG: hypothetical protein M3R54_00405, partial [Chloroflexota bacterium]|nr:hypothetical protein [Chloroflexota bacterium]